MSHILLVGIGNTLRCDDGAGQAVVRRFEHDPRCSTVRTQQLLPEHVDELARCDHAIFVDAAVDAGEICFQPIDPAAASPGLAHFGNPAWLAHLCQSLHGRTPQVWSLRIPVADLGCGESFSSAARAEIAAAIQFLENWLDSAA